MTSWGSDNHLHSTRRREEVADYSAHEDADKYMGDDFDEGGTEYDFEGLHKPVEDQYLDPMYEDRYYLPEPDFDYL